MRVSIDDQILKNIADEIRAKNGEETLYSPGEMADKISELNVVPPSHTMLVKDMELNTDVSGLNFIVDTTGYTSQQLIDGITGGNPVVGFGTGDETSNYMVFISDDDYISLFSGFVDVYKPDGTSFGTIETNHIYVWYISLDIVGGEENYNGIYILEDLTTTTNYGSTTLPNNYLLVDLELNHYSNSVIWNCLKLSDEE